MQEKVITFGAMTFFNVAFSVSVEVPPVSQFERLVGVCRNQTQVATRNLEGRFIHARNRL